MKRDKSNAKPDMDKLPQNLRIAIVVAKFNSDITEALVNGVKRAFEDVEFLSKNNLARVFEVPGSVELPLAAATCAATKKYDAVICLGAVLRGDTDHYEYVCKMASDGINRVSLEYMIPVMFGLLTCNTKEQALERTRNDESNTGYQVAIATLDMLKTLNDIKQVE